MERVPNLQLLVCHCDCHFKRVFLASIYPFISTVSACQAPPAQKEPSQMPPPALAAAGRHRLGRGILALHPCARPDQGRVLAVACRPPPANTTTYILRKKFREWMSGTEKTAFVWAPGVILPILRVVISSHILSFHSRSITIIASHSIIH
jgi:hypothetical protein